MISVIMPVYNNYKYLRQSIDSVLSQTYGDFEFIILDDQSTEPVWDLINSYSDKRIIPFRNSENIGLTKSLNKCLDLSKGELIARQDSDDISLPDRFEKEVKKIKEGFGMVSCWGRTVHHSYPEVKKSLSDPYLDKLVREVDRNNIGVSLVKENCILGPAVIYSVEVVKKIGYYDETLYFAQDYNYWLRLADFFKIGVVEEELYLRRKNPKSVRSDGRNEDKKDNILVRVKERAKTHQVINGCSRQI